MDLIFFWLSKLIWLIISPDFLLVFFICCGVLLLLAGAVKKAKFILSGTALAMVAITFVPVGDFLIAPLEQKFPAHPELPAHVDGIIQLGGAESGYLSHLHGQAQLGDAAERYLGFIRLMRLYPDARLLFTGGSGRLVNDAYKDADVARMVFKDLGVDTSRIIFESRSRNTYENAKITKSAADPAPGQTWVLVTTAWHMPRAWGAFTQQGWEVIPYPVDYLTHPEMAPDFKMRFLGNLGRLTVGVKEWTGLLAYYLTGKTPALLPGPS